MGTRFDVDKSELIEAVLDRYGARYSRARTGWQKISCINEAGHVHGDRNPSASVNLTTGQYRCFGCEIGGDGFDLMMELENVTADKVNAALGVARTESDGDWLF